MSRKSVTVVLAVVAVATALATPASHYRMGPTCWFEPAPAPDAAFIGFASGLSFDTRCGEPTLPAELTVAEGSAPALHYIIQFTGPLRQTWFDRLERMGIPTFGYVPQFAVIGRLTPEQRAEVSSLPFVRWTGLYQPAYKLEPGLLDGSGLKRLVVLATPGEAPGPIVAEIERSGGSVSEVATTSYGTTVMAVLDIVHIPALARLSSTFWVQEWTEPNICNNNCQWVMQTGWRSSAPPDTSMAARKVWANGVRGQGIILSTTDTGLNTGHNLFRDPGQSVTPPGIWPTHRKVVAFKLYQGASTSESPYHGSHVNGTVGGDDSLTGGTSYYDGMAIKARLYFMDLTNSGGSFVIPTDFTSVWDTVYLGRGLPDSLRPVTQHSGSWGWSSSSGAYLIQDASTDNYCWRYKDFLCIMAAGNESSTRRIRNPGIAKDVLTIGATNNGTGANAIASFSSRGPTQDGRLKPNVMAPGVDLWSAQSSGQSGYSQMSGTSMATPAVNGAIGLLRCYLREGYYPTGTPEPGNRIDYITSALLRSMAMASADPNIGSYTPPDNNIGWGRFDADSVLYFPGDTRRLLVTDDTLGVATGEYKQLQFRVNSVIPLRVCLAWTDTAAAPSANPTLVNNLNLELTSPSGTFYRGNKYASGQSTANPTGWDSINVEECARVNAPDTGLWTIKVYGYNVRTRARQWFAWTITGDVALPVVNHDVGVRTIVAPSGQVDSGTVVVPRAVVANLGSATETFVTRFTIGASYSDTTTVNLAAGASDTVSFAAWLAETLGVFTTRCSTELAGDENPANDAASDSVTVVPGTGIEEQPGLPRAFQLDAPLPSLFFGRTAIRYALPRQSAVTLAVCDVTGAVVRTLVTGTQRPGWYTAAWDGRSDAGRTVSRGIYYCRLTAGQSVAARKTVKAR